MKLDDRVIEALAEMIIGNNQLFPYRSSTYITEYFHRCGFSYVHDGSTRKWWAKERLGELNLGPPSIPDLPSDDILRIIAELFDPLDYEKAGKNIDGAVEALNGVLKRHSLVACLDATGKCYVRNTGTGTTAPSLPQNTRPLSQAEIGQRHRLSEFLDTALEDDLTDRMVVPFFRRLGFHRVSQAQHKEKILEFGKDLWMKYQLPTGHWLYFCAVIKRDKIDSAARVGNSNVASVLTQARMAIDHPIFDPDTNRKVLLDHIFVISAGEITRAARTWLVEQLDAAQRRHLIFMDRGEFLDHAARILLDLEVGGSSPASLQDDIPF